MFFSVDDTGNGPVHLCGHQGEHWQRSGPARVPHLLPQCKEPARVLNWEEWRVFGVRLCVFLPILCFHTAAVYSLSG